MGAAARVGPRLFIVGAEARSRQFSSLEEIKENEAKVQRHKAFVQKTATPKTLTDVLGPGTELHVPEDITEIFDGYAKGAPKPNGSDCSSSIEDIAVG